MLRNYKKVKTFFPLLCCPLVWAVLSFQTNHAGNLTRSFDYSSGVLAVNTNKSSYLPGEIISVEFGVLDFTGEMVCESDITASIYNSHGDLVQKLATGDGSIKTSSFCQRKENNPEPDFFSQFALQENDSYSLSVEAKSPKGHHHKSIKILVSENEPFVIERKTRTRIYPLETQEVLLQVKANNNFIGKVKELVPEEISTLKSELFSITSKNEIIWDVNWKKGESYELRYEYKAPELSPDYYQLGPLYLIKSTQFFSHKAIYTEPRAWQVAVDDTLNLYASNCTSAGAKTWANPTNAQGNPSLSSTANLASFTTSNSSSGQISDTPILNCTGFSGRDLGTFTSARIVFSFATAGRTIADDYINIEYIISGSTYSLVTIVQNATEKSNNTNGGYWGYPAANIASWTDISNATVRFSGVKAGGPDRYTAYVDSVWIEVIYAARTFTQNDFAWYTQEDTVSLTNIWPPGYGENLLENQALTQFPASNKTLKLGDKIRVQMNITVGTANLPATTESFKLEYAVAGDCTTASGWQLVGAKDSATVWRLYDEANIGNSTLQVNQISTSNSGAEGYYSEINQTANNPNAVSATQNSEWDWPLENNGALDNTTYCFRMAVYDENPAWTYNSDSYPKLTTAPGTANVMRHGNVFESDVERGLFWAD